MSCQGCPSCRCQADSAGLPNLLPAALSIPGSALPDSPRYLCSGGACRVAVGCIWLPLIHTDHTPHSQKTITSLKFKLLFGNQACFHPYSKENLRLKYKLSISWGTAETSEGTEPEASFPNSGLRTIQGQLFPDDTY